MDAPTTSASPETETPVTPPGLNGCLVGQGNEGLSNSHCPFKLYGGIAKRHKGCLTQDLARWGSARYRPSGVASAGTVAGTPDSVLRVRIGLLTIV